jgi:hypothetical protein
MSSTYVSGFYAAALRRASGYAYLMYFETCESNVTPRTPRWRPQYVGSLPEILSQIVEYVDCCDDGLTKGARGRPISSSAFVRRCEEALGEANLVTEQRVTLEFGRGFNAIAPDKLAGFDEAAQRAGITIHFTRNGDEQTSTPAIRTVDLGDPATVEVVLAFQREANVPLWKIFDMSVMARLPGHGDWTPAQATSRELDRAGEAARQHLGTHRVVKMRCPWPASTYVQEEHLVLDAQHQVLSANPLRWFCQGFLGEGRCTKLGESSAALKAFRSWMTAATISVDAPSCEVEATPLGEDPEASASVAVKLTEGRSVSLPARGPASAVFTELRYCDAARFSVVAPQLRTGSILSLL